MDIPVVVTVTEGQLKGCLRPNLDGEDFYSFLGIPYGEPPVGQLRFKAPQPAKRWVGVKNATKDGDCCIQRYEATSTVYGSEDCLNLNVFTKKLPSENSTLKPVMVYIHGGAFIAGSNHTKHYGPEHLMLEDIVLVALNFRLGFLGHLHLDDASLDVPGNAGLKDQQLALKWIQKNIKYFNGDPENVTIFGESAGAASVHYHLVSPSAKGLFHKAIMQSGCLFCPWSRSENLAVQFAQISDKNVKTEKEALEILTSLTVEDLYASQEKFMLKYGRTRKIGPNIEKPNNTAVLTVLPEELIVSGQYNKVPIMIGYTNMEGILLEIYQQVAKDHGSPVDLFKVENFVHAHLGFAENDPRREVVVKKLQEVYCQGKNNMEKYLLASDCNFIAPTVGAAKLHAKTSSNPVYLFCVSLDAGLNYTKHLHNMTHLPGTCHADELGYLFNIGVTADKTHKGETEILAIRRFVTLWTNFAKFGNPTPVGNALNVIWKPIDEEEVNFLDIGKELTVHSNPEPERLKVWKQIFQLSPNTTYYLQ